MPQLPEQIRPYVAAIAKYHFWILGLIVPLVLVPLLFAGRGKLDALISAQRSQIEGQVSALNAIKGRSDHPNESMTETVEKSTAEIQAETMAEWSTLWDEQKDLRVWPKTLGDDFIKAVGRLKPGASLDRSLLQRYQNNVLSLVRELPVRMGVTDLTAEGATGAGPGGGGFAGEGIGRIGAPRFGGEGGPGFPGGPGFAPRPVASGTEPAAEWSAEDQRRLMTAFVWEKPPTTVQVLLAQEELWVYGVLCDVIKKANASATDRFNAPIPFIEQLAVGYPAAEDQPGGQGTARIFTPAANPFAAGGEGVAGMEGAPMGMPGMDGALAGAGAATRPPHPRFSGAGSAGPMMGGPGFNPEMGGDPAAAAAPVSPDDMLREWIYVDFTGKPLTSAELASSPDARLLHLVPFTLRVTMDQRKVDALLADLATSAIPIDVRQVRINPGSSTGGPQGMPGPSSPAASPTASGERPFDVLVELRGTVGLATPPDEAAIAGAAAGAPGA